MRIAVPAPHRSRKYVGSAVEYRWPSGPNSRGKGARRASPGQDKNGGEQAGNGSASDHPDGDSGGRRADYRPRGTAPGSGLFATLKRTFTEFEDNFTDWAASLTYYGRSRCFRR